MIHCTVNKESEINCFGEILIRIGSAQMVSQLYVNNYDNTAHAKTLTNIDHGLVMRLYCLHYGAFKRLKGKLISQNLS